MRKGQSAFDYMMIAAFSLAMIIPVFYYAVTYSNDSIISAQAQDAVNTLAKAADNTYSLGEGSLSRVQVNIPSGVTNISIASNRVLFTIRTTSGFSDVVSFTKAPILGSLSNATGSYFVILNNTGPTVNITKA